ncbi:MAG: hypothetical protein ACPHEP_01495 [Acidimicrobiales bacterium]
MAKKAARKTEQPKVDVVEESVENEPIAAQDWKMPRPMRGEPIIFYPRGIVVETNAEVGFVNRISAKSLDIVIGRDGKDDVYHKDDPRLVRNPDLRLEIPGVWDFLEERSLRPRVQELEERVSKLEG